MDMPTPRCFARSSRRCIDCKTDRRKTHKVVLSLTKGGIIKGVRIVAIFTEPTGSQEESSIKKTALLKTTKQEQHKKNV